MNSDTVSYREYGKEETTTVSINDFIKLLKKLRNNYE